MSSSNVHLELEVLAGSEPIAGVLRGADGAEQPFTGWLALMECLEALRKAPGPPTPA